MKLWICRWPNGEVSFVHAHCKQDAIDTLDEIAGATEIMLREVPNLVNFFVGFSPCNDKACVGDDGPHWHADDDYGKDLFDLLGDPAEAIARREARAVRLKAQGEADALKCELPRMKHTDPETKH